MTGAKAGFVGELNSLRGIAALTFPLMLGAMVLAPDLYAVLFGPRWERSVFLFQVLCLLGMSQSVGTTAGWLYLATGRTDLMLRWILIAAAVILPGFVVGPRLGGLEGVAISYAATSGLLIVPSLLPAFPGLHAQRQALEYGVKVSGATVHVVDEHLDAGPIVAQEAVPVHEDDTEQALAARILEAEHRIYPRAVRAMLQGRVRISGRHAHVEGGA